MAFYIFGSKKRGMINLKKKHNDFWRKKFVYQLPVGTFITLIGVTVVPKTSLDAWGGAVLKQTMTLIETRWAEEKQFHAADIAKLASMLLFGTANT